MKNQPVLLSARKILLLMEIKGNSFFFLVLTKNIEMSLRNYAVIL